MAGAPPHEAMHSTRFIVNRPSGVFSPGGTPSFSSMCYASSCPPRIEQAIFVQTSIVYLPTGRLLYIE